VDTDTWEKADLYDPDDPGADGRRALLEYLTARGATLDQMTEAHRLGRLPAVAGDLARGPKPATLSVEAAATRSSVPVERILRVLLAAGLPVTSDSQLPEDVIALMEAFEQGAVLMGEEAILAFTRVLGAAASTIAEAAVALFNAELGPGSDRNGSDELARAKASEAATASFTSVPEVLSRVLLIQFDRATQRVPMTRGWSAPAHQTGGEEARRSGEFVALGFVDLVGSTRWAERLSLREHSLALSRFESAAWSSAVLSGGRVVKMIGDEVFFTAPSVDAACRIGIEVCQAAAADSLLPPARGAVGEGAVTPREGDYFGPLVNLVSRLAKVAAPGTLVVTEEAAGALSTDRWTLRKIDQVAVRDIDRQIRVFAVSSAAE